jgi:hypothetical protein
MRASMSRSLCTYRAITIFFLPQARVIGGGTGVVLACPGVGGALGVIPEPRRGTRAPRTGPRPGWE